MNPYFNYTDKALWKTDEWNSKISTTWPLVKWINANQSVHSEPTGFEAAYPDPTATPHYNKKTRAVVLPEVVNYWAERNVYIEVRAQGGLSWILVSPMKCVKDFSTKYPTAFSMFNVDLSDPWWAMRMLQRNEGIENMISQQQDAIWVYLACNGPDVNRVYVNILQEAYVMVPGDMSRVYLDVSAVVSNDASLKEISGFTYVDEKGNAYEDPDSRIETFKGTDVKVINVTGRWENRTSLSRDQIAGNNWSSADYDLQRVVNSQSGALMAEGFRVEYDYADVYDPAFVQYWKNRGLLYESHEYCYRHWKAAVPLCAMEHPERKLPVIAVFQEVNCANEHLAVTESSYFYEYFRIAAQGECILVNFVLEDWDSNDLLEGILKEAFKLYPCDLSRVYAAGHSHNGFFALEFAIRHPKIIAAVATFGDPAGMITFGNLPMVEGRLEKLMSLDIPVVNLTGMCESMVHYPLNRVPDENYKPTGDRREGTTHPYSLRERVESYQLRLKAFNCPNKTEAEIVATANSKNKAIRVTGIPADYGRTIWVDGFEVYLLDVKNNAGRTHLQFVAEENMPHNTTPTQQKVSWSFLRRFARDTQSGEIIELYE